MKRFFKIFNTRVLSVMALCSLTILGYQNCQQGGSALEPLSSVDCSYGSVCKNQQLLDADRITVQINDTNGVRTIPRDTTIQMVTGSCNPGGYDSAKLTVTLKRIGYSSPAPEVRSVDCVNKSWNASFSRVQEFANAFSYADLTVDASITAYDEYGDIVVPSFSGNGQDRSILRFQGSLPDPTPTPGPQGAMASLWSVNFRRSPLNSNWLVVDTYIWPAPTPPINLTMTADYLGSPSQATVTKKVTDLYPSSDGKYYFNFEFSPGPGAGKDNNIPATFDLPSRSYNISVSLDSAPAINDTAIHRPFPNPFPIGAFTRECIKTSGSSYPARSVVLRGKLIPEGSQTSFPLEYEFRSLDANNAWKKATANITLTGDGQALINITEGQYANAYKELLLVRVYFRGGMQTFVSDCR